MNRCELGEAVSENVFTFHKRLHSRVKSSSPHFVAGIRRHTHTHTSLQPVKVTK